MQTDLGYVSAKYLKVAATAFAEATVALVDSLSLTHGTRVLDVGCGAGDGLPPLLKAVGAEGHVVGLDHDGALLEHASPLVAQWAPRLTLVKGEAAKLPFDDGEFDAVSSSYLLQHQRDPLEIVREMARGVRTGGLVAMLDTDWASASIGGGDLDIERRLMTANAKFGLRSAVVGRELPGLARAAGLVDIKVRTFTDVFQELALARELFVLDEVEQVACQHGFVSTQEAALFRRQLEEAAARGALMAHVTVVLVTGIRPA